ncbi:hypothetical protein [Hydrogenophaga sp.]|uniref:hypothetical protein n=1 Tax=Hydrogenophaga sp. TaxID=1904254 RepID=UPI0025C46BA0|nr:hypothetical protein [Hydrogenophaga sp.]MBT9465527.1 hypothetical protein [Hydrogenophaga sp.]
MNARLGAWILLGLGGLLLAWGVVPIFAKVAGMNMGESVVGEIKLATDLNPWVEKILLTTIGVVAATIFVKCNLTLSWRKQLIGMAATGVIWIAAYGFLAFKTSDPVDGPWFNTEGEPLRCYVLDTDGVRLLYIVKRDPRTGQPCKPVTPELEPRLRPWMVAQRDAGGKLRLKPVAEPADFFGANGGPLLWFYKRPNSTCEYFELPGVHPMIGEVLRPITKEDGALCRAAEERVKRERDRENATKAAAEEQVARRSKYVGVPVQRGSTIVATSELGGLDDLVLEVLRERGNVIALKPSFVAEGRFNAVWNGGHDLATLGLEQSGGAVLLRPASAVHVVRSPDLGGLTFFQQKFSLLVIRPPYTVHVQSAGFSAEGRGFSDEAARAKFRTDFATKLRSSLGDKLQKGK